MIKPTVFFRPFGEAGPKLLLFGKNTGDWNPGMFQNSGDHRKNAGLYSRFDTLAGYYNFRGVAMPWPAECNTAVCKINELPVQIHNGAGSVILRRGAKADGVVLPKGNTGAITSADCPVILAFCPVSGTVIMAHGGSKSVIDVGYVLKGREPREHFSVVDSVMSTAKKFNLRQLKVFITCGISGWNYQYRELAPFVGENYPGCVAGDCGIDLKKIIAGQFLRYGVNEVTTDFVDTFGDIDKDGKFVWHSCRRGKTPTEKRERNLVLVINK